MSADRFAAVDSREAFDNGEYDAYLDQFDCDPQDDGEEDCDYEDDGQPTEYEEWQDYFGGDDWDHGQYDCEY